MPTSKTRSTRERGFATETSSSLSSTRVPTGFATSSRSALPSPHVLIQEDREYDLGREGGHSHRRILHASDATGQEIVRALIAAVRRESKIEVLENHIAIDLVLDGGHPPACWGAYVLDRATEEVKTFAARASVLATGGAGKVYLYTSNPDVATGDGVAMAYRAGATHRQHGVLPVPPDLPLPPAGEVLPDHRGAARRGRDPAPAPTARRS